MGSGSTLQLVSNPQGFFQELLAETLQAQKISLQPETEFYLTHLLGAFIRPENLFLQDGEGNFEERPLALLVKEAIEEPAPKVQNQIFRKIGDVSLYTAGFFYERLRRKSVGLDYYIDMGGAAYSNVAAKNPEIPPKEVFEELAHKFSCLVDVLAEMSNQTASHDEKRLVRLYENWEETGDPRIEKTLIKAGIIKKPVK